MTATRRFYLVAALLGILAIAAAAVTLSSQLTSASNSPTATGDAARIDDGKDRLPEAGITVDQAIAAAKTATIDPANSDGETATDGSSIGEIDVEDYNGTLVFNVDVSGVDVKVDAATGAVLGQGRD